MRLFKPVSLSLAAAAALLAPPAPAHAAALTCATSDARAFPLTTRIHGGPATYEAGGGYGTWYLDLTNTTARTCADIHPVVVLVDKEHALEPDQPHLEFHDGPRTHPVRFETTDQDELVGVFRKGLTVGPGRTLTVKLRLALTSDAVPNEVTANAAVVQRQDDDGEWVGQSNDYRFAVDADPEALDPEALDPEALDPEALDPMAPGDRPTTPGELARTGPVVPTRTLTATAAALLLTGAALLLARRRR